MRPAAQLTAFVAILAVALGVSFGVGNAVGPVADSEPSGDHAGGHDDPAAEGHDSAEGHLPGGLQVSQSGYTLDLDKTTRETGRQSLRFRILGEDGEPVTDYVSNHEKDLHLIVVRRDATGFQHVHPTLDESGTWEADVDLTAGTWRVFADVQPKGADEAMTLGADVQVSGAYSPESTPTDSTTARVGDYTVTLEGELAPGKERDLTLRVTKDGKPVSDLDPYLGAYGHLVALRSDDLAYLHVHPNGEPGDGTTQPGPEVTFTTTAPSSGAYRLFLDFKHEGKVRTAEFTTTATTPTGGGSAPTTSNSPAPEATPGGHGEHDH